MDREFGKGCLILKAIPLLHARDDLSAVGLGQLLDPSIHEIAVEGVFGSGRGVIECKVAFARLLRRGASSLLRFKQVSRSQLFRSVHLPALMNIMRRRCS
jgi:hypothetical protein